MLHRYSGAVIEASVAGGDVRFFVMNPKDAIQQYHYRGRFYESEEIDIIRAHWRNDGPFVDVGANVGNHTIFVSKFLDAPQIIVFEPNPVAIAILRINLALNQCLNVDTQYLGIALGSTDIRQRLREQHPDNLGGVNLVTDPDGDVHTVPGDSLLASEPIAFVKIDVEGMEMEVLQGLERTISRWRPNLFIEVWVDKIETFSRWCDRYGYRITTRYERYAGLTNFMTVPK